MSVWKARRPIWRAGRFTAPAHIDTFTGSGVNLESHTPDAGGSWTKHSSYSTGSAVTTPSGRLRGAANATLYYYSGSPNSADYQVEADFFDVSSATQLNGIALRIDTAADSYYFAEYQAVSSNWRIRKKVSGTATTLATGTAVGSSSGKRVVLRAAGSSLTLWVDGVLDVSAVDSSITSAGKAGVYFSGSSTDSFGLFVDNFDFGDAPPSIRAPRAFVSPVPQPPPDPGVVFARAGRSAPPPAPSAGYRRPVVAAGWSGFDAAPVLIAPGYANVRAARLEIAAAPRAEIARTEAVFAFPGMAWTGAARSPGQAPGSRPPRPVVASAEAPPSYPGSVVILAGDGQTAVSPPPEGGPTRQGMGGIWKARRPIIIAGSGPAAAPPPIVVSPRATIARSEWPPPDPGSVRPGSARVAQAAVTAGLAPRPIIAAAETPPPAFGLGSGGAVTASGRAEPPVPPPAVPVRSVVASAEAPPAYPGSAVAAVNRSLPPPPPPSVGFRRPLIAAAEAPPSYPGAVRWIRGPKDASAGLVYRVYANAGSGPINYGSIVASTAGLSWTSGTLTGPAEWKYGVRVYDNASGLEESNLDAMVTVILDGSANDVTQRPGPPEGLTATAISAGSIRVEWTYPVTTGGTPTGFRVYRGTGGAPSYGSPVATVLYSTGVARTFRTTIAGGVDGTTYWFGVRAYNATAEESNTVAVSVAADGSGPQAVASLSGTAVAAQGDA